MLQDTISKLQIELVQIREKNSDTSHKIKRSLDVVEQAQYEKTQLESEIRRLKDELERQHDKLRETIHDQVKRTNHITFFSIYLYCFISCRREE